MRTHFLARTALAVALATSGVFLVGCSDDDDNVTTPDNPAPIATPTPAPAPQPTPAATPAPPAPPEGRATVFVGRVKSVTLPTLRIGGIDVVTDEKTTFHRGGETDLNGIQVGEIVRVHGSFIDDGVTVLATKISVEPQ